MTRKHCRCDRIHLHTLHNVCAIHVGGGRAVRQGVFSTLGNIMIIVEGYLEYIGKGGKGYKAIDFLWILGVLHTPMSTHDIP